MDKPDPKTDAYGYMQWTLLEIAALADDSLESTEVALTAIRNMAQDALDASGFCGA